MHSLLITSVQVTNSKKIGNFYPFKINHKTFLKIIFILEFLPNHDEWHFDDPRWEAYIPNWREENYMQPRGPPEEFTQHYWNDNAQNILKSKLKTFPNYNIAKNVVIMIGDGMSLSSIMATR